MKKYLTLLIIVIIGFCLSACDLENNCEHTWDCGNLMTYPTLTEVGVEEYTCTQCGKKIQKETTTQTQLNPTWDNNSYVIYDGLNHSRYLNLPSDYKNYSIEYYYDDVITNGVSSVGEHTVKAVINNQDPYIYLANNTFTTTLTISKSNLSGINVSIVADTVKWLASNIFTSFTVKIVDCNSHEFTQVVENTSEIYIPDISSDICDGTIKAYVKANETLVAQESIYYESQEYTYQRGPQVVMVNTTSTRLDTKLAIGAQNHIFYDGLNPKAEEFKAQGFTRALVKISVTVHEDACDSHWVWFIGHSNLSIIVSGDNLSETLINGLSGTLEGEGTFTKSLELSIDDLSDVSKIEGYCQNTATTRACYIDKYYLSIKYLP